MQAKQEKKKIEKAVECPKQEKQSKAKVEKVTTHTDRRAHTCISYDMMDFLNVFLILGALYMVLWISVIFLESH